MYGYVVPDKSTLRASDFVLYRSFYCGMCCQTGVLYGNMPRFTTNYDFAFFSALLHDYSAQNVVIEEHGCILNPKKKAILQPNPLLERLVAANILLSYQKADDGVIDGDGVKYRIVRRMLKKPFRAAKKAYPQIYEAIEKAYAAQRKVEKSGVNSIDRAADPFASLLKKLPELILGVQTDDNLKGLCYNIGKFVYLADALDDITEDSKHKRYNPFLAAYGNFTNRKGFIAEHKDKLEFCFNGICARAQECFSGMRFTQSYGLLRNIVFDGLPSKAKELLNSEKKLKSPRV
ncbi:MAG: hypothetical protein K2M89_02350 [Clostridiales bacterium]|nr:hypothetical protein [Clostridiales bacterium]